MVRTRRDGDAGPHRVLSPSDNPLVRAVGRVPLPIQAKFLVPSVATVVLLVILGVLGLRVIGESNDRVVALGELQQRAATYREMQAESVEIGGLLSERMGALATCQTSPECLRSSRAVATRLASVLEARGVADDPARLGFVPPAAEKGAMAQIARDYLRLADVVERIVATDDVTESTKIHQTEPRRWRLRFGTCRTPWWPSRSTVPTR